MPVTESVKKRVRQNETRRAYNKHYKSKMRSAVKQVLQASSKSDAEALYPNAVSLLDKMAAKGIIHHNKAAREKSKITRHVNNLSD